MKTFKIKMTADLEYLHVHLYFIFNVRLVVCFNI